MQIIIKFSPEIVIKSRAVRIFFITILIKNIKIVIRNKNKFISILRYWDHLKINCQDDDYVQVSLILMKIPGIHHILLVHNSVIVSLEDIYYQIISISSIQLSGKTFCIRIKRQGKHIFSSQEIARYLGNKLCHNIDNIRVNLTNPDETIHLEIKDNNLFIVIKRYQGLGGLPIGTQQHAVSLVSGGFDSAIASYMLIRRGCQVHYCFFNFIDNNIVTSNNIEVYKMVYYLWNQFACSHNVKFVSINFLEIIQEIFSKIKKNYIGIILKRMMIRAAASVADNLKIKALVTGEVLGQVSSQTLENLTLINSAISSKYIIFRPLIAYDKELIIKLSRKIGTEIFSRTMPEYCGMITKKSTAKANKKCVELEESYIDFTILNKAISQAHIMDVHDIPNFTMCQYSFSIETTTKLSAEDVILDIRSKHEQVDQPLQISKNTQIQNIPFYKLIDQFPKLNQNKTYLLYCKQGIMSRLQAIHLYQKGFRNIKVYRFVTN